MKIFLQIPILLSIKYFTDVKIIARKSRSESNEKILVFEAANTTKIIIIMNKKLRTVLQITSVALHWFFSRPNSLYFFEWAVPKPISEDELNKATKDELKTSRPKASKPKYLLTKTKEIIPKKAITILDKESNAALFDRLYLLVFDNFKLLIISKKII